VWKWRKRRKRRRKTAPEQKAPSPPTAASPTSPPQLDAGAYFTPAQLAVCMRAFAPAHPPSPAPQAAAQLVGQQLQQLAHMLTPSPMQMQQPAVALYQQLQQAASQLPAVSMFPALSQQQLPQPSSLFPTLPPLHVYHHLSS
jgi:hypothetical protein